MSFPRVEITENCLREGMQIESTAIPIEDKLGLLDALSTTGLKHIVVASFVSPRYTPQMADADELVSRIRPRPGVRYSALALNDRGRERAAALTPPLSPDPARPPALFCHLCDTFVRRNTNRSQADEIARWAGIVAEARAAGAGEAGIGLGAAFGSNFEGGFTRDQMLAVLGRQHDLWEAAGVPVTRLMLADPMGWVTPWRVEELLAAILDRWPAIARFDLHFHNSRGLALASTYEALRVLDDRHTVHFDTTAGGIGGCPYCGNGRATGMVATEDLVNMLHELGIDTGIDIDALVRAVWLLEEMIGRPSFGHVSKAGPHPHGSRLYDPNLPMVETLAEARHFLEGPEACAHQIRPWREPITTPATGRRGAS